MDKKFYQSKTVWTAIVTGLVSVLIAMGFAIPTEVYGVLGALGLYSVRDAL
jgi:hypothetical protein